MRSLKEKGWKPVSNDTFKIYNIYRRLYVWVATLASQPYKTSVHLFFLKKQEFNFQHSPLIFAIVTKRASLVQFFVFSFAELPINFSIIYDNAYIKDCRYKQGSRLEILFATYSPFHPFSN